MAPPMIALGLISLQLTVTSMVLGFTAQRSLLRAAALPFLTLLTYFQLSCLEQIQYPVGRAFLGAASVFLVILYIDVALLSRWTFTAEGPTSPLGGLAAVSSQQSNQKWDARERDSLPGIIMAISDRLRFGFTVSLQSRFPGTKWAVNNIPPFSRKDPSYIPGKAEFLLRNILKCSFYIFILRLSSRFGNPDENPTLFSSNRIPFLTRLGNISGSEMSTRVLGVLAYWIVQYMVIEVIYGVIAVLAVALRITDVDVWPPVFGSVDDAWSLRQFWGRFYHQLIRQGCSSIAHFVTYSCMRLRKGGLVARYAFLTLVFTVSGVFHTLSDISQGIPIRESGAMQFFCIQALGIMFEDTVQALFKKLPGGEKAGNSGVTTRIIGYIWLVTWLAWTSPIWIYPTMQRDTGTPIIPF